jgi:hypothetical protein
MKINELIFDMIVEEIKANQKTFFNELMTKWKTEVPELTDEQGEKVFNRHNNIKNQISIENSAIVRFLKRHDGRFPDKKKYTLNDLKQIQVFNFKDGKLDLYRKCKIEKSFQYSVKSKLGSYASEYNGTIYQEANKMKDYVTYEDSTIITAIVKFHPVQSLQQTLWDGEVTFEKQGDSILIKVEKLKILKYSGFAGEVAMEEGVLTEEKNSKIQQSMLNKLKLRVEAFFNKFIQ